MGRWERSDVASGELMRAHRLFVGAMVEPWMAVNACKLAWRVRDERGLMGRPFDPERLHITLMGIGDFDVIPAGLVETLFCGLDQVSMPSFQVCFDRVMSFKKKEPRAKPLVLTCGHGADQIRALHDAVATSLCTVGFPELPKHSYTPHVTLLYDRQTVADQPVEPLSWRLHDFTLVHSLLGQTRYIPLARWLLRP